MNRAIRLTVAVALASLAQVAAAQAAAAPAAAPPRVLALPASDKAAVYVMLRFRGGSVDDPQGKAGLTALAAKVMAEGGTVALDARRLREALFPIAADLDVRVDVEQTTFMARVHRDAVEKLVPILVDVVTRPRWDPKEFARIRQQIVDQVGKDLRQADVESLGKAALAELMYRGHPYGHIVPGHLKDLGAVTLAEARAQAGKVFTADRLTIGVAGGYPSGLPARLQRALAGLPRAEPPVAVPHQLPPLSPRFLLVEKPGASSAISMGYPFGLARQAGDWAPMSVARSAMGEHRQFNGRLMQRLRERRGLNYGDYAYVEHFVQQGGNAALAQSGRARTQQDFTVWLRPVQNENRLFAVRAALRELQRSLAEEPFSDDEVARTKGFLDGYLLLFDQTDGRKLGYALDDDFNGVTGSMAAWRAAIPGVTPAAVNAAWRRWIDPSRLQIVVVGPDMAALKKAILADEPSPVHYQKDAQGNVPPKPKEQLDEDAAIARTPLGATGDADVVVVPVEQLFE